MQTALMTPFSSAAPISSGDCHRHGERIGCAASVLWLAMAAMGNTGTNVGDLCQELGVTHSTLYRHVSPIGEARPDAKRVLNLA
jgi:hypothetical protein